MTKPQIWYERYRTACTIATSLWFAWVVLEVIPTLLGWRWYG